MSQVDDPKLKGRYSNMLKPNVNFMSHDDLVLIIPVVAIWFIWLSIFNLVIY